MRCSKRSCIARSFRRRSALRQRLTTSCPSGPGQSFTSNPAWTSLHVSSSNCCSNLRSMLLGVPRTPPTLLQKLNVLRRDHAAIHHPNAVGLTVLVLHGCDHLF